MKYWCTKYALSKGLLGIDCDPDLHGYVYFSNRGLKTLCKVGRDIFNSKEDAISNAKSMQKTKIASLKKQMARVEGLVFE